MTTPRVTPKERPITNQANVRRPGAGPTKPQVSNEAPPPRSEPTDSYRAGKFKEPIEQMYGVFGLGLAPFLPRTGMAVLENAEQLATTWDQAARTNPAIKRILDKMISGGGWGAILMAHAPIGMIAVQESGIISKIPFLSRLFPKPQDDEPETPETDDFGNPIPFNRREPVRRPVG
jgi:hypothetical protein